VNQLPPRLPTDVAVRLERYEEAPPPPPRRKYWLHPSSGLLILGVDWLFFAPEVATAEVAAILTSPLAFLITGVGVFWIQRRKNGDSFGAAALKGLLSGIVAGIPTSIGGTILGTLVLLLSGLSNWNKRADAR
jgi:drug/metabolite transporter (DMT)-like permease